MKMNRLVCFTSSIRPAFASSKSPLASLRILGLLGALAALLLGACAPAPVVRYQTFGPDDVWTNGQQLHPAKTARLAIHSGFLELSPDPVQGFDGPRPLTFLISAENRSDSALMIEAGDFRLTVPGKDSVLSPIDPETVIQVARIDRANADAHYETEKGTEAVFGVTDLIVDVAQLFSKQTPDQRDAQEKAERKREEDRRERQADDAARHERDVGEAVSREKTWSDQALRKTTLFPGIRLQGKVSFAAKAYTMTPDSLMLQYRERDGHYADLGLYGMRHDQPTDPPRPTAKVAAGKPVEASSRNQSATGHESWQGGPAHVFP